MIRAASEVPEAAGEDVGGDAFAGFVKLLEGAVAADHQSRTISSDQRSPKISSEMLTGHPERRVGFCGTGKADYR